MSLFRKSPEEGVVFQPILNLEGPVHRVVYHEALARPALRRGQSVEDWVCEVERRGECESLDRRMISAALYRQRRAFDEEGQLHAISVNVSPQSICSPAFTQEIERVLCQHAAPESLCFEITERQVPHDPLWAARFVDLAKGMGCSVALDDFSALPHQEAMLDYLVGLDTLKLSRSTVLRNIAGRGSRCTLERVESLAAQLQASVVAEGIDTPSMLGFFERRAGQVDRVQGHLFGKPGTAFVRHIDISALIADRMPVRYREFTEAGEVHGAAPRATQ